MILSTFASLLSVHVSKWSASHDFFACFVNKKDVTVLPRQMCRNLVGEEVECTKVVTNDFAALSFAVKLNLVHFAWQCWLLKKKKRLVNIV